MTIFMIILMVVFAMTAIIIFAWSFRPERAGGGFRERGERRSLDCAGEDRAALALANEDPTSGPSCAPIASLANTDLPRFMTDLRRAACWKRILMMREEVGLAEKGRKKVAADTSLMAAQAEQVKTYLRESNEIASLEREGQLGPLRHTEAQAGIEADTEEHRTRKVAARVKARDLRNPSPPPPPPPEPAEPKPRTPLQMAQEELEEHMARGMARLKAIEKVRSKFMRKHAKEPEVVEEFEELLGQWREEASVL